MASIRDLVEIIIPIAILVSIFAGSYQLLNYRNAIAGWGGLVISGMIVNLACYYLIFNHLFSGAGKFIVLVQVIGFLLFIFSYLVFVIHFTGSAKWITQTRMVLLAAIPMIIIMMMILEWKTLPGSIIINGAGFGINVNFPDSPLGVIEGLFAGYSIFVGLVSAFLLAKMLFNSPPDYWKIVLGLMAVTIIFTTAGFFETFDPNILSGVSIYQLIMTIGTFPIFLIAFTWKAASLVPITKQFFKDTMRDGYVIINSQNKIIDFNPALKNLLGDSTHVESGYYLADVFPTLNLPTQTSGIQNPQESPVIFESQDLFYEVKVSPVLSSGADYSNRMVVFHNVTEQDRMEDTLKEKNIDLSRSNAYFAALASLTLSLQTARDSSVVMETLGNELHKLGLKCFVALYKEESKELIVEYFSESIETIRSVEKIFGRHILGFALDRGHFSSLYQILETRHIQYFPDEESGIAVFLGNLPGWVMEPLIKASAVSRHEPSLVLPLIAAEKVVGLMGAWGYNLQEIDIAPFQIFGSQVGWAIEKALLQEVEVRQLEELSHANAMITALAKVSSQLETTPDNAFSFVSLGDELAKIDMSCAIATYDQMKEIATIRYISIPLATLQKVEQLMGFKLVGWQIPRKYWPNDIVVTEGTLDWYENAESIFKKLFPNFPKAAAQKIYQLLKGSQTGQLCFLPLKMQGDVIGVMLIWGKNLNPKDSITLGIFSDQVAAILERNNSYENEIRKSGELARLNSMIMALSGVASQLGNTTELNLVMETLGKELKKVNLHCMVGTFHENQQSLKVEYLSFLDELKQLAVKMAIPLPEELKIPSHHWPMDKAILEKTPYWDSNPNGDIHGLFPHAPGDFLTNAMSLFGLDLNDPVCYLPMISEEGVIGILAVWGKGLIDEDIPALSIFANQVATAIHNTWLYMNAQNEIIERTQTETRIRETLAEKEILIKEVHHRVKNNLQVITSLLNLQASDISDPNILDVLRESQNRVRTMALIHEKLYQSSDLARIDFSTYLQSLVYSLAQSYRVKTDQIEINVQAEKILMDLDTAIPCGLIVNELVSNSIKYAFPDHQSGRIEVLCNLHCDKQYTLIVCDNGVGLPAGFDSTKSSSLGLKLVYSLIQQIEGELSLKSASGTRYEITFARPEIPAQAPSRA